MVAVAALVVLGGLGLGTLALAVRSERELVRTRAGGPPAVPFGSRSPLVVGGLALTLGVAVLLAVAAEPLDGAAAVAAVALGGLAAVAGGGPLAVGILHLADPNPDAATAPAGSQQAQQAGPSDPWLLLGGFWIGLLERAGVAGAIIAGWPEGIAAVLVIKGFGRYPELGHPPAAERFIIGTLSSVLWACACAGTVLAIVQ